MRSRHWSLRCPACRAVYRLPFLAPWRCPREAGHGAWWSLALRWGWRVYGVE